MTPKTIHPAQASLLAYFAYDHLPAALQDVSRPFHELATGLAEQLAESNAGAEATTALRKLLEAKDCAVRAALSLPPVAHLRSPGAIAKARTVPGRLQSRSHRYAWSGR